MGGSAFAPLAPLSLAAPAPMRFAWAKAGVQTPDGIKSMHVLFIDTPTGASVFYFEDDGLRDLLEQGSQQLSGLVIVRDPLPIDRNGHGGI